MINFKLNITMNDSFSEMVIPVEKEMIFIDFLLCLQLLLKRISSNVSTFDIYDLNFNRIALVGENQELYIAKDYRHINRVYDLKEYEIDTLEIIGLTSSVRKVLKEEYELQTALENYKFEE